jgi:hypothetical protein
VQEFDEELAAAEVKEEGGAEGGADAAGLGVETKQYVIRKLVYFWWRHSTDVNSPLINSELSLYLIISMFPIPAGLGVGIKLFRASPICRSKIRKYSVTKGHQSDENNFEKMQCQWWASAMNSSLYFRALIFLKQIKVSLSLKPFILTLCLFQQITSFQVPTRLSLFPRKSTL